MSFVARFSVNGRDVEIAASPEARLLDVLRLHLSLTGTKEGCGEGECGSCSVLLDGEVVCACLVPLVQLEGRAVTTIEGLAGDRAMNDVQQAFVAAGGVQCGACTPGIVITAHALLASGGATSRPCIREALAGNLCRCTGYERVFRAVELAAGKAGC